MFKLKFQFRLAVVALIAGFAFAAPAVAQWIDAKTGQAVPSGPMVQRREGLIGDKISNEGVLPGAGDPNRAFDPTTGRNFFFDPVACVWKDAATGKPVPSGPMVQRREGLIGDKIYNEGVLPEAGDPNRAFDPTTGRNFVRDTSKRCPTPPSKTTPQPQTSTGVGSVPPVKLKPFDQRILDIQNTERVAVGAPPLRWNPALEQSATEYAQQLARTGQRVHAPREGRGDVRENLNQGMLGWNTDQMMRNWLDEKTYFVPGLYPNVSTTGDWKSVSHYTQMIWPTTTDLGCGEASGSGYKWLVCRYSPGGNKDGKVVGLPQPSFGVGPARAGLDVNVASGSRGGLGNNVNRDATSNVLVDQLFKDPSAYQWIDVKTGKPVTSLPVITDPTTGKTDWIRPDVSDRNRAYDPRTGRNFARNDRGEWIDVKTGKPVTSLPVITDPTTGKTDWIRPDISDRNRAYDPRTGRNFAKEPLRQQPLGRPERG